MPTLEQAKVWYDERDPVHGFDHVLRVLHMAERLGRELGADLEILRAAALLHDVAGAHPAGGNERQAHEEDSAAFARKILEEERWEESRIEAVVHCIRTHRFRGAEKPQTLEARILFDSDKLDVNGAFGVARTIGYTVQAGLPFFREPSRRFQERGEVEPGELRSAYHEFQFKLRHVKDRFYTEPARRLGERRHAILNAFFEQLAAEARDEA